MNLALRTSLALCAILAGCSSSASHDAGGADLAVVVDLRQPVDTAVAVDFATQDLIDPVDLVEVADLTDNGAGRACGGRGGKPCAAALYCDIANNCGRADEQGTCKERPAVCGKNLSPVCGCDGQSYDNDCLRQKAGVSLENHGICGCAQQCGAGGFCANCFGKPQCLQNGQVC